MATSKKKIELRPVDFTVLLEKKLTPFVEQRIRSYKFAFTEITSQERDQIIAKIIATLTDPFLVFSGKHRLDQWEKGWGQNLDEFASEKKKKTVIPHYFGKYPIVRINQRWVKTASKDFEYNMLGIILDWLFDKYLRKAGAIYEFGCGTGHNLMRLREINPSATLWGLDWATSSQRLIAAYAKQVKDDHLFAHRFDFFNPDKKFKLEKNAAVITVAALEQIGDKHERFIQYLLSQKPKICIHIEPIAELLDEKNLLDYLSISYFRKRKYLNGFLTRLRELEHEGKVRIIRAQRTKIGSFFIEGYSVIVWEPR